MTIQLECISLIIPIAKINQCYPGGFRALIGTDPWDCDDSFSHDRCLYREGAMNSFDIEMRISHWQGFGLVPMTRRRGKRCWNDMCVVDRFAGPTLPCDWLEWNPDEATVRYKPTQPDTGSLRRTRPHKPPGPAGTKTPPSELHQGLMNMESHFWNGCQAKNHPAREAGGLCDGVGGWIGRRAFRDDDPVYPGAFPGRQTQVRETLEALRASNKLRVDSLPQPLRLSQRREPGPLPDSRVEGILVGLAIGDALGNTSESMSPARRLQTHGEIRDYLPNRHANYARIGLPSDDTQLSVWTLETLLACGEPDLNALVRAYRQQRIYGIGGTMRAFFRALDHLPKGAEVWNARQHSAGNGALMRVPGAFLPHAWTLDAGTLDTVLLTSALTHDDPSSNAACVAFAQILAECLWGGCHIGPGFFWETFVTAAAPIEGPVKLSPRIPGEHFRGSVCELVEQRVPAALQAGASSQAACDSWYSGAFLLETVPSVLFILERYRDDPEEALVRAVMDTWDNDTVAAIVGAVMGALHGVDAFPRRWREGLTGRTGVQDDGKVGTAYAWLRRFGGEARQM